MNAFHYRNGRHQFSALLLVVCLWGMVPDGVKASNFGGFPETGSWFNRAAGDRTGMNMEIQNGVLSGAYYGFDGEGRQVWLLFSGPLDFDGETDLFSFSGSLTRSSGGGCIIDCPADGTGVAHSVETVGNIEIEFLSRSQARFRVNDGDFQMIAPLIYGSSARQVFPAFPDVVLPDFEGPWAFDFIFHGICGSVFSASVMEIGSQSVESDPLRAISDVRESVFDERLFPDQTSTANASSVGSQNSVLNASVLAGMTSADSTITTRCSPPIQAFINSGELVCAVSSADEAMPVCEMRSITPAEPGSSELILSFSPTSSSDSRISGLVLRTRTDGGEPFLRGIFSARRLDYD